MRETVQVYSPNARWGDHVVAVTLKQWDYERTYEVRVGGNCRGQDVLRAAVERLEEELLEVIERGEYVTLARNQDGDLLEFDENSEIDVPSMVVSARVVAFEPEVTKARGEPVPSPAGESQEVATPGPPDGGG